MLSCPQIRSGYHCINYAVTILLGAATELPASCPSLYSSVPRDWIIQQPSVREEKGGHGAAEEGGMALQKRGATVLQKRGGRSTTEGGGAALQKRWLRRESLSVRGVPPGLCQNVTWAHTGRSPTALGKD
ncbi:hypothetical protein CB1_001428031 [Camelus ferus]|nr:hypothetical protein CB1_001428031 [Camelus ferus]